MGMSSQLNDQHETIALTLTDNQLENFSVTNFTYDQLAQLAKIGLIALNNAANNGDEDQQQNDGGVESQQNDSSSATQTIQQQQQCTENTTTTTVNEDGSISSNHQVEVHMSDKDDPNIPSTNDGQSILIVTPSDADEEVPLRIISNAEEPPDIPTTISKPSVEITSDVLVESAGTS